MMEMNTETTELWSVLYLNVTVHETSVNVVSPVRGDPSVGEKHRADSDSGAAKHVPEGGEESGHQPQDPGGHHWTQGPAGEPAAGEEVEECCGAYLVLWASQV